MEQVRVEPIYIQGERKDVACIVLHGFIATPLTVKAAADIIAKHGITVNVPLLSGHGSDEYDLESKTFVDWINDVRKAYEDFKREGYKDIIVCGASMGGLLTLNFAEIEKDLKAIIVFCAPLIPKNKNLFYDWRLSNAERFRIFPKSPDQPKTNPLYGYDRAPISKNKDIAILIRSARHNLSKIKCPMLAVYSKADHLVKAKSAAILLKHSKARQKELLILAHSSHSMLRGKEIDKIEKKMHEFLQSLGYPQLKD